jgi:osmoprotectant transport system substrate-binding protein
VTRRERVLAAALLLVSVACTSGSSGTSTDVTTDDAITVASFDFPESELLAEIYAQALEGAGVRVEREPSLGPRELVLPALERGLIELVPEYQGSLVTFLGGRPSADPTASQRTLDDLIEPDGLLAATPAPAQDRNAVVVTTSTAVEHQLSTISDLAGVDGSMAFGGPPECPERPLCLLGLHDRYGLRFASFVPLDAGGPLTVQALHGSFIDVGLLFTTDPALGTGDLVVLSDDRALQPSERIVPIIRADALERFGPEVLAALDAASAGLTTESLRAMNTRVGDGTPPSEVAAAFLAGLPSAAVG